MFADKFDYKDFLPSESLSKLKSTKFAPPPCTPQAVALPQNTPGLPAGLVQGRFSENRPF